MLAINDKDYTITFALYFSAEWLEPRLNLSKDLWGEHLVEKDDDLVPGEILGLWHCRKIIFILISSKSGVN